MKRIFALLMTLGVLLTACSQQEAAADLNFAPPTVQVQQAEAPRHEEVLDLDIKLVDDFPAGANISMIRSVIEYDYYSDNIEDMLLVPGRLKTLFGEPQYTSINNEDWFDYYVECNGRFFIVYGVSADTHIGGEHDEESRALADQLADYILQAEPSDYEWTSYYMDADVKVTTGIKDGKPYMINEPLELSEEELSELYQQAYQLDD
ncbi:MAG: hypothetical protein IJ049_05150 [Oscillospiraceae bacterium]|nr:hypothetical protein [Oscillospiraceae bacterium]